MKPSRGRAKQNAHRGLAGKNLRIVRKGKNELFSGADVLSRRVQKKKKDFKMAAH